MALCNFPQLMNIFALSDGFLPIDSKLEIQEKEVGAGKQETTKTMVQLILQKKKLRQKDTFAFYHLYFTVYSETVYVYRFYSTDIN